MGPSPQQSGGRLGGNLAAVVHLVAARLVLPLRWLRHKQPAGTAARQLVTAPLTDWSQGVSALHPGHRGSAAQCLQLHYVNQYVEKC